MLTDWSKARLRCSCIGKVMTNAKGVGLTDKQAELLSSLQSKEKRTEKQDIDLADLISKRDAPQKLSDTCISYLKEVYVFMKYGKEPVGGSQRSKYTLKGKSVEDESIAMLSRIDDFPYTKNEERKVNDFLTGECDIVKDADNLKDIKSSWDFATLLSNIDSPLNADYFWQGQGYMSLWNAKHYEVCYCLVNMPQDMIEGEKKRIFYIMNPATEESPEYLKEIKKMENNMTFDEIPIRERIIRFSFDRDDSLIEKIKNRWQECIKWLENFEKIHLGLQ